MLAESSGAALTLSALAARAQVSRRTLYVHWGTIQQVISEAVDLDHGDEIDTTGLAPREILRTLLVSMRTSIHNTVSQVALTTMLSHAAQDPAAGDVVKKSADEGLSRFVSLLGPVTVDQYAQLVGPILYSEFVAREPASDALVDDLVDRGVKLLALRD
ncbi:MAG: transcriptional regulator [Glaciihabitans sp.]|nr:transcriptional regulator [Glaciihabitans sp.]